MDELPIITKIEYNHISRDETVAKAWFSNGAAIQYRIESRKNSNIIYEETFMPDDLDSVWDSESVGKNVNYECAAHYLVLAMDEYSYYQENFDVEALYHDWDAIGEVLTQ